MLFYSEIKKKLNLQFYNKLKERFLETCDLFFEIIFKYINDIEL